MDLIREESEGGHFITVDESEHESADRIDSSDRMATIEQLETAVVHMREKEELYQKIAKLEKNLKEKDDDISAWRKLAEREIAELHKKIVELRNKLEDKDKALKKLLLFHEVWQNQSKREKEELYQKIAKLEKNLKEKDDDISAWRKLAENSIKDSSPQMADMEKKVEKMQEQLIEKEEVLEDVEYLNQALLCKERRCNDEVQEARKELVNELKNMPRIGSFGVKSIGELDNELFIRAMKRKYNTLEAEAKGIKECSLFEMYLRDPKWHPFKIITVDGENQEIVDPEDEKLKTLKEQLGDEVYDAVTTALMELNLYNPIGRYPILLLWNYSDGRKATLKEAISSIFGKH